MTSPELLKENQSQQLINLLLDEHGALRARDGTLKQGVAAPRPDRPIVKLYDLNLVGNTTRPLAIQLGTFGPNTLFLRNTNPWTTIADFATSYATPDIVTFTNLGIIAGGNAEPLKSTDGTVGTGLVALTGAPNASSVAVHLGFLWAGNTSPSTTATTGPSSLSMSDLNNPNSWPGANQTFVAKDDGQSIQALTQYTIAESGISPTATLIVWKDFSGYEATGVLGTAQFSLQKIKSDMGCVAGRTAQFISGFGIVRLTHRGFALYDGVNDTLISEDERPRIFGRDAYIGLDWANISKSMATQCANPPLYLCACPVNGSNGSLQRVFVFDLVRRSWSIATFANDLATCALLLDPNQLPSVVLGDFSKGFVRQAFAGAPTDDGTPINWSLLTRAVGAGSGLDRAYWRRVLAKVYGVTPGTAITATLAYGPSNSTCTRTSTLTVGVVPCPTATTFTTGWSDQTWSTWPWSGTVASTSAPGWGLAAWGSSAWGAQPGLTNVDVDLDYAIGVIANNLTLNLTGSGPAKIRGIEFHARAKPLTNSTALGV